MGYVGDREAYFINELLLLPIINNQWMDGDCHSYRDWVVNSGRNSGRASLAFLLKPVVLIPREFKNF